MRLEVGRSWLCRALTRALLATTGDRSYIRHLEKQMRGLSFVCNTYKTVVAEEEAGKDEAIAMQEKSQVQIVQLTRQVHHLEEKMLRPSTNNLPPDAVTAKEEEVEQLKKEEKNLLAENEKASTRATKLEQERDLEKAARKKLEERLHQAEKRATELSEAITEKETENSKMMLVLSKERSSVKELRKEV